MVPDKISSGIVTLDLNNDGKPDIIAFNSFAPGFYVYLNNGNGTFHLQATEVTPAHLFDMVVGDFNHDGYEDVAFSTAGSLHVWFNSHASGFSTGPTTSVPVISELSVGDFDGDGKADVFASSTTGTFIHFGDEPERDVADFNGDGKQDIALVEAQNSTGSGVRSLVVLTGKGGRSWNPELTVYSNSELDFGVAAIRANQDSKPDLLVDTFANNATTTQFFVNDTSGGHYGGCALPMPPSAFVCALPAPIVPIRPVSAPARPESRPCARRRSGWTT